MRFLLPITGSAGIFGVFFGALFKILHLPGANEVLLIGLVTLLVIFIPITIIQRYRKKSTP